MKIRPLQDRVMRSGPGDLAERVLPRTHANAAEDRRAGGRRVHGKLGRVRVDLRGELAGRRENQGTGDAAPLREESRHSRTSVQCRTHSSQM